MRTEKCNILIESVVANMFNFSANHLVLISRTGVALRRESREFNVEELLIAKSGSKLKGMAENLPVPSLPRPRQLEEGQMITPECIRGRSAKRTASQVYHRIGREAFERAHDVICTRVVAIDDNAEEGRGEFHDNGYLQLLWRR
jgi:hypothetical protein